MKANYLHTAGILVALYVGAACTSNQGVLGVKKDDKTPLLDKPQNAMVVARASLSIPTSKGEVKDKEVKISNARPASGPTCEDSIVSCQLESQVFEPLGTSDLEAIRGTNTLLKQPSEAYTQKKLLDIYHNKQGSFRELFGRPDSRQVQWIADYRGEHAAALRNKFMCELYTHKHGDEKTLERWIREAPQELFAYGPEGDDYVELYIKLTNKLRPLIRAQDLRTIIRGYRILLSLTKRMPPLVSSQVWPKIGLSKQLTDAVNTDNDDLKKEAQSVVDAVVETCKRLQHDLDDAKTTAKLSIPV